MARPRKDNKPTAPCKKPEGRPTKWTTEAIEAEADAFLEWIKDTDDKKVFYKKLWYKDFALERGYSPQRFDEFKKENEKFSDVYCRVKDWQESKLFKLGLIKTSNVNSDMAKFALARRFGWKEEQVVEHTGNLQVNVIQYANPKEKK